MNSDTTERRVVFEEKMRWLQSGLLEMGGLVQEAIAKSVDALCTQDVKLAQSVMDGDDLIDELQQRIEEKCLEVIATQQPMAKDLRRVATLFKLAIDLERMGDYASSISRITLRIADQPLIKPLVDIPRMSKISQEMVRMAIDAYVNEDISLARAVGEKDDEVDKLFGQIFRELLTIMIENPTTITQATHLLFVGRWLERLSDHATNIAEEVVFLVTGNQTRLNR